MRLRASEPLRASAATDVGITINLLKKTVDDCRLPDTRLASHRDDATWTVSGHIKCALKDLELIGATNHRRPTIAAPYHRRVRGARAATAVDLLDRRCESVAEARNRCNVMLAAVAERLPDDGDIAREPRVFDEAVGPDGFEQLLFGNHLAGVLDEGEQRAKCLRRQRDHYAIAQQHRAVR